MVHYELTAKILPLFLEIDMSLQSALLLASSSQLSMCILSFLQGAQGWSYFFGQWNFCSLYIQEISFAFCILVDAPQVYIELPIGISRRELCFWAMEFWLVTCLGAITKIQNYIINNYFLIYILVVAPQVYILSSLQGALGGSSIFGQWDISS